MTNELQIFKNSSFGNLEVLTIEGKQWFPAIKVAEILGYANPRKAIRDHSKEKGVTIRSVLSNGGTQNKKFIDEGNLYRLITKSKLPQAEQFEEWVFDDVLPTLRKTGSYQVKPLTTSEQIQLIAKGNTELDERVTAIEESYPIMHGQAKHIQQLVARKVAEIVRNKFNGYYKETSKKLFAEIYRSIKKIFQVPTYNSIPRGRYEEAVKFIEQWQPSYDTVYQLELNLKEA
ncbi:BRO family protein [Mammaliicoccus sciuri]|uniref:BRO family protein n=1 Tax=Mammaliicoccus sciuri TaxID=1296 RepID=UPI000D1E3F48|nr:ORF6C domain-containing protein [Mammaliicoccus sciuri]MCJ0918665.1 ORF6C domain-containing protein [Mammaliicoccus sciuri]MCJ0961315.1 ORF6C domain-containing protein [Mammaliicoccus sciuri]PTJ70077.1 phage repressor protein [Mammaliicoccus sciuri]